MTKLDELRADLLQQQAYLDALLHSAPRAHRAHSVVTPEQALDMVDEQRAVVDRLQAEIDAHAAVPSPAPAPGRGGQ